MGVVVGGTVQRGDFLTDLRTAYATLVDVDAADLKDFLVFGSRVQERRHHRWWLAAKSDWMQAPEFARLFVLTNCDPANPDAGVIENWSYHEIMAFYAWARTLPGWTDKKGGPVIYLPVRDDPLAQPPASPVS